MRMHELSNATIQRILIVNTDTVLPKRKAPEDGYEWRKYGSRTRKKDLVEVFSTSPESLPHLQCDYYRCKQSRHYRKKGSNGSINCSALKKVVYVVDCDTNELTRRYHVEYFGVHNHPAKNPALVPRTENRPSFQGLSSPNAPISCNTNLTKENVLSTLNDPIPSTGMGQPDLLETAIFPSCHSPIHGPLDVLTPCYQLKLEDKYDTYLEDVFLFPGSDSNMGFPYAPHGGDCFPPPLANLGTPDTLELATEDSIHMLNNLALDRSFGQLEAASVPTHAMKANDDLYFLESIYTLEEETEFVEGFLYDEND